MVVMIPVLVALAISGWMAIQQGLERVSHENQALAQATARHVDYVLRQNLERLEYIQFSPGIDIRDADPDPERKALHNAYLGSIFETVFISDLAGTIVWAEPYRQNFVDTSVGDYPPVLQVINSKRALISDVFSTNHDGKSVIFIIAPLRNREGQVAGIVGGQVDPAGDALQQLILPAKLGETSYIDIVDSNRLVLTSSDPQRLFTNWQDDTNGEVLAELERLPNASWSIGVGQSKREALAPARALAYSFVITGILTVIIVFFLSWGMARSIIKPIGQLKTAAQNISRGNLLQPVPALGSDEIGELGQSFDVMRLELKKSLEEIREWNRQLEAKIEERTHQLQDSYHEIARKEAARGQLLQKILMIQEEERKRVARELHDDTTQSILGLVMRLEAAAAVPDEEADRIKGMLTDIRSLALNTLDSVHKVIFDLRPSVLDDLGLLSALRWYAQNRLGELRVKARVEVTGDEKVLPPQIEIALFRAAQEAITNIAKHAKAKNVLINVEFKDSAISIEVEDDGKGFDVKTLRQYKDEGQGVGLLGMQERIELLGGQFNIASQPGKGTIITLEIPLV